MSGKVYRGSVSTIKSFDCNGVSLKRKRIVKKPRSNAYNGSYYKAVQPRARAVKQVTQLNQGRKSPAGVDGKTALSTRERLVLCQRLQ